MSESEKLVEIEFQRRELARLSAEIRKTPATHHLKVMRLNIERRFVKAKLHNLGA